jgi:hypothetical protein
VTGDAPLRQADRAALGRPGRQEDSAIALAFEVAQGEVATHRSVDLELDAETDDPRDLGLQDIARKPVGRDTDGHHPARDRHRLEHGHRVAQPREVVGRGHAGGATADDPDLLGPLDSRWFDRGQAAVLGGEALERADRDRLVEDATATDAFARRRADPAADRRERVDLGGDRVGVVIAAGPDQPDISPGVRAGRAGDLAGCLGNRRAVRLHRSPDLPCLGSLGGLPAEEPAPRRGVLTLECLACHARQRKPGLCAHVGHRAVDRPLPRRQGRFDRLGHEGHHHDRAFADADATADAFTDLDGVLHHPVLRLAGARRLDARPGRPRHVECFDRTGVHADAAIDAARVVDVDAVTHEAASVV